MKHFVNCRFKRGSVYLEFFSQCFHFTDSNVVYILILQNCKSWERCRCWFRVPLTLVLVCLLSTARDRQLTELRIISKFHHDIFTFSHIKKVSGNDRSHAESIRNSSANSLNLTSDVTRRIP